MISINSTLQEILDCPEAKAVVDRYLPGWSENPLLSRGLGLQLGYVTGFPQCGLTPDEVDAMADELDALGIE